jgi:hypothetical protein
MIEQSVSSLYRPFVSRDLRCFHKTEKYGIAIKTYFPETSAVEELLKKKKGRIVFMSRLKIEKSVVLFEWRHWKAQKEIQFDYGRERTIRKQK